MVLARVEVSGAISLRAKETSEERIWSERRRECSGNPEAKGHVEMSSDK